MGVKISQTLMQEHRLGVLVDNVLRGISGPKWDEIIGG
jgi:hypothetical protein